MIYMFWTWMLRLFQMIAAASLLLICFTFYKYIRSNSVEKQARWKREVKQGDESLHHFWFYTDNKQTYRSENTNYLDWLTRRLNDMGCAFQPIMFVLRNEEFTKHCSGISLKQTHSQ